MVPAVIEFDFDPALHLGDLAVRLETLALALTIVVCVALAAVMAGRTSSVNAAYPELGGRERGARHLRRDDLLYILLGVVPVALLGGRLGYVLIHWDFYSEHPEAWFDPTQGGLELSLAVVFGTLAGYAVAAGLGAPAGRWLHLATVPVLLGLTVGKFVGVVGGTGQGAETVLVWATAYLSPGPWGSPDAATPAHPSQLYEAVLSLVVMALIVLLLRIGRFLEHDGRIFFAAMSLWALTRVAAAFTWRDPVVVGPFAAAQVLGLTIAVIYFALFVLRGMYTRRTVGAILAARARVGRPAVAQVAPVGATVGAGATGGAAVVAATGLAAAVVRDREKSGAGAPLAEKAVVNPDEVAATAKTRKGARRAKDKARPAEGAAVPPRMAARRAAEQGRAVETAMLAAAVVGVQAPVPAATVGVERLAAAASIVRAPSAATSSRSGPVWLERLEPASSAEAAVNVPPVATGGAPLVIRSVIVELVAAEPVVGTARRVAELVEVAVAGTAPAPIQPAPVEPGHLLPVITSPSPAVPIWQEIEHERLAPAGTGRVSQELMMEGGQPRHRTARELLAMAEAVRLAEAERVGRPAPIPIPTAVALRVPLAGAVAEPEAPNLEPVDAVPATEVLVEHLEAEVHIPVGIVPDDPLASRTNPFTPSVALAEPSVAAERLEATEAREEAVTECVESIEPGPEAAEPEAVEPDSVVTTVELALGAEGVAPANDLDAVAPAEPVTLEIEEIHREFVSAAAELNDPLAPQHDLFEAMGEPADRFDTPTEAPTPELARAAGRANREYRAHHVIQASMGGMPLETAEPGAFPAAEPEAAAPEPIGAEEEPAVSEPAPAAAVIPARGGKPRRAAAQPKPKPPVEPDLPVERVEAGADASAAELEPAAAVEVESTMQPEPSAEAVPEALAATVMTAAWVAQEAESEPRETPPIDLERERRRTYRPARSRREFDERQRAEDEAGRGAQESPDWTAAAFLREAEGDAGEAGAVAAAPDVEPAAVIEPALEPEPSAALEPEPSAALEPEAPPAVTEGPAAPLAPREWAAEEADADRHPPPDRPSRPEPQPEPVAAWREPALSDHEPGRRGHYVPARSRREYEKRQRAEEEARRAAEEPPAWTVRAMRREAQGLADEGTEHVSLTAREQQHRLERAAEHRRRMRFRPASRRALDEAYDVSSQAVGEGSAFEIEDIGEGGSDSGQQVWAGQGEDDRPDD